MEGEHELASRRESECRKLESSGQEPQLRWGDHQTSKQFQTIHCMIPMERNTFLVTQHLDTGKVPLWWRPAMGGSETRAAEKEGQQAAQEQTTPL
eukprot:2209490-Amphidinium_carterae.1